AARSVAEIRRAHMLEGDLGRIVRNLRSPGSSVPAADTHPGDPEGAAPRTIVAVTPLPPPQIRPLRPMLAAPVTNIAEAFRILNGNLALEHKLDGARVQIHRDGATVRIFTRSLNEVTASLPEVVEAMVHLPARHAIFDGEVIAIDQNGRP